MKKNWKLATLALATTGMMLTTACTDDNIGDSGIDDFACNLLNADITEDVTLKAGETYTLESRRNLHSRRRYPRKERSHPED